MKVKEIYPMGVPSVKHPPSRSEIMHKPHMLISYLIVRRGAAIVDTAAPGSIATVTRCQSSSTPAVAREEHGHEAQDGSREILAEDLNVYEINYETAIST